MSTDQIEGNEMVILKQRPLVYNTDPHDCNWLKVFSSPSGAPFTNMDNFNPSMDK